MPARSRRRCLLLWGWIGRGVLVATAWLAARAEDWSPTERVDQPWKILSLGADAGLRDRTSFDIDFERNPASSLPGRTWVATSDGLREYDGYAWRRHGRERGLPSEFVRCVRVTRGGELWVGSDQGAGVYDGRTYRTLGSEQGLAGPNVRRIAEDADGTLWFCSDTWPEKQGAGGLASYRAGQWRQYRQADGLPSDYVVNFFRDRTGRAFVATRGGVARQEGERWVEVPIATGASGDAWDSGSFAEVADPGLMLSNGRSVFVWRDEGWRRQGAGLNHEHGMAVTSDGRVLAVGRWGPSRGAFVEWRTNDWVQVSDSFVMPGDYTIDVKEAPDGAVWALGYDCLIRWPRRNDSWREFVDLPPPWFAERGGRVWFAQPRGRTSAPKAPVRLDGARWDRLENASDGLVLARDRETVWGWTSNRITRWKGAEETTFPARATGLVSLQAGEADARGRFWVAGDLAGGALGVAVGEGGRWETHAIPGAGPARWWRTAVADDDGVWFVADGGPGRGVRVVRWRSGEFSDVAVPEAIVSSRPDSLRVDRRGTLWLFGGTGLYFREAGGAEGWQPVSDLPAPLVIASEERDDGVWFACHGAFAGKNGLARFREGTWTSYPIQTLGDLTVGADGTLVWGGDGRVHQISAAAGSAPSWVDPPVREAVQRAIRDPAGRFWILAGRGVYCYRPDEWPPETSIIGPANVTEDELLAVTAEAVDAFQPRGTRKDHRFAWRLEGGAWSAPETGPGRRFPVADLGSGGHRLEVVGVDPVGRRDPSPAVLQFRVRPVPLQNREWFVPVVVGTLAILVTLAGLAVQARRRLAVHARRLEDRVAERTAELRADVERRQRAEAAALEGEERFRKAFHASPAISAISTDPEGVYLEVNRAFTEILGYEPSELMGRTAVEAGVWGRPEQRAALIAAVGRGESVRGRECEIRTKDGRSRTVLLSIERIEWLGRPALLFVGLDVTERTQLEMQLRQAHKLEAIGLLSGGIAHDFNNILGAILTNTQMAGLDLPRDHAAAAALGQIEEAARRAGGLVRQILAFARQEPNQRHLLDLGKVVGEAGRLLRATIPSGIDIAVSVPSEPCLVFADESQLHQVLLNLGTNAWQAHEGRPGRIRIELESVTFEPEEVVGRSGLRAGRYRRLRVVDSGKGMDPATRERIFDPFFTTKPAGTGTGLGLSVVLGIVQTHEGAIEVRSKPGEGSTFDLFLPAAEARPSVPVPGVGGGVARSRSGLPRGQGQTILVIDDEGAIVQSTRRALEHFGYQPRGFTDAGEALEALRARPGDFALVMTDLNMPAMSGFDVVRAVLEVRPDLPVLLTSGFVGKETQKEIEASGIRWVLRKPSSLEELITTVHRALSNTAQAPTAPANS